MLGTWNPISFSNTHRQHFMETLPVLFLVLCLVDKDPCRLKGPICKFWRSRNVDLAVISVPHEHPLLQKPGRKGEERRMFLGTCSNVNPGAPLEASWPPLGPSYYSLHASPREMAGLKTVPHPIFGKTIRGPSLKIKQKVFYLFQPFHPPPLSVQMAILKSDPNMNHLLCCQSHTCLKIKSLLKCNHQFLPHQSPQFHPRQELMVSYQQLGSARERTI